MPLAAARPGATIIQLGLGGNVPLSVNVPVAKEITLRGTFRYHEESTPPLSAPVMSRPT